MPIDIGAIQSGIQAAANQLPAVDPNSPRCQALEIALEAMRNLAVDATAAAEDLEQAYDHYCTDSDEEEIDV